MGVGGSRMIEHVPPSTADGVTPRSRLRWRSVTRTTFRRFTVSTARLANARSSARVHRALHPHPAGQFTRFVAVGPLGVALGAVQIKLLWLLNPVASHRAASTWIISSAIGVLWVHALHCA